MRFAVKARASRGSRARAGLLHLHGDDGPPLETPCLLLATRKGLPHFLTPDLLHSLHPHARAFQVSPLHFIECPSSSLLEAVGGIHNLISLPEIGIVAAAKDSVVCEADPEGSNKLGASFNTPFGRRLVKPSQFMSIVNAMKPDIWVSLPDEVPASVSIKRNIVSVDRTLTWLDQCLSLSSAKNVLGCIVGGSSIEQRKRSAQETCNRDVVGFSLCGFGLGESGEERVSLLEAAIGSIPEEKLRHACGLGMPEEVLQAVDSGIDVLDSTYPYVLTMGGYAMVFSYTMDEVAKPKNRENPQIGADSTKINLRSVAYRYDMSPIFEDCTCYTCQKHNKAYINHLLNTHEMLAQTLLDIHNNHHYFNFFQAIRKAIVGNNFQKFRVWFINQRRESHLTSMSIL